MPFFTDLYSLKTNIRETRLTRPNRRACSQATVIVSVLDRIRNWIRNSERRKKQTYSKFSYIFKEITWTNAKTKHTQTQYSHLHKVHFHYLLFHLQFHFALTWDHCILKGCLPSLGQTNLARYHLRIQQSKIKGKERINSSCLSEWKMSSHVTLLLWGVMWSSYAVFLARRLSFSGLKEGIVLGLSVTGRFDTKLFRYKFIHLRRKNSSTYFA